MKAERDATCPPRPRTDYNDTAKALFLSSLHEWRAASTVAGRRVIEARVLAEAHEQHELQASCWTPQTVRDAMHNLHQRLVRQCQ